MALDHKAASKHIEKALTKGHIVKPLKERTHEDIETAKVKAREKAAPKKAVAKKAPAKKKVTK